MSDEINGQNNKKKLVVIGDPISHSLSPIMHNAALKKLELNDEFVYDKSLVKENELASFVELVRSREIYGANVTLPHKVSIIPFVDKLTKEAELIGAVNTLYFEDRKVVGHNTDGIGCLNTLNENGVDVNGKKLLLLGAGGASRAIGFVLALNRVSEIIVVDIIEESAKKLAEEINEKTNVPTKTDTDAKKHLNDIDILVHCTPIGMRGDNEDKSLLSAQDFEKKIAVMDIVYNPQETKLLAEAGKAGCKTVQGLGMLAHQGAVGFEIWTGKKAPVDIMIQALKEALK